MARTISVVVEPDVRLDSVRNQARTSFRGAATEADRAGAEIEQVFRTVDDDVRRSFAGLETEVGREFSGIGRTAEREFSDIEDSAKRSSADVATSFEGLDDDIGRSFAGIDQRVGRELDGIGDEARTSFDDVGRSADRAADDVAGAFDDVESKVGRDLSGIGTRVRRELDDIDVPNVEAKIVPPFERAGDEAGEALTGGIERGVGALDGNAIGGTLVDGLGGLASKAGPIGAVAATIGGVFGDEIATGIASSFNSGRNRARFALENGLGATELRPIGRAAGEAYAAGIGDGLADVKQTAALLQNELSTIDDGFDLSTVTRQAEALEEVFGVQLAQSIEVARRLVANDLVNDSTEAFNLIGQVAQQYRLDFEEILEVASEFSPVFGKLGIDGAQAFDIIGESVQRGLLPNVDRAAELFEEFNIRLSETDTLREPIQALGLDFEQLQQKLANGQGAEALADISAALLQIEDPAQRNAVSLEIFGAAIESASDPAAVLRLLTTADAVGEVGTQAEQAAQHLEDTESNLRKVGRAAEGLGRVLGDALEAGVSFAVLDFSGFENAMREGRKEIVEIINLIPGLDIDYELPNERFERLGGGITESYTEGFGQIEDSAREAAGGVDELTGEVVGLDEALAAFAGRFEEDQIMRSIEEDTERALEAVKELAGGSFDLANGFDITTEAGRAAEASLERLSGNTDRLIQAFNNGEISAFELAAGQRGVEAAVREVAGQMGLTEAETQRLIDKYAAVPDSVRTEILAIDNATDKLQNVLDGINRIPSSKTFTLRQQTTVSRALAAFRRSRAAGGYTPDDGEVLTGERGPELADFGRPTERINSNRLTSSGIRGQLAAGWELLGAGGPEVVNLGAPAMIYSTAETRRLLASDYPYLPRLATGGVAREETAVVIGDNPNARIDPEIAAPQSFIEEALRKVLAEAGNQGPKIQIGQVVVDEGENLWEQLALTEQLYT